MILVQLTNVEIWPNAQEKYLTTDERRWEIFIRNEKLMIHRSHRDRWIKARIDACPVTGFLIEPRAGRCFVLPALHLLD